jgi:uncharacterized protein
MACHVTKLIFLILLVIAGVLWFKHRLRAGRGSSTATGKEEQKPVEDMVRCQTCGVNLPRSEAILSQGRIYCCDEHRRGG